ncbi:hypothetical protein MYBA111488_24665 [Mycobacterium basiliense]
MWLSGTLMFSARFNGSGSIVRPPGKIVIGSSAPDASIANGMALSGIDRPPGNRVNAGRMLPVTSIFNGILEVPISGILMVGILITALPVDPLLPAK